MKNIVKGLLLPLLFVAGLAMLPVLPGFDSTPAPKTDRINLNTSAFSFVDLWNILIQNDQGQGD